MKTKDVEKQIESLSQKAAVSTDTNGTAALKFSQAALNLAHTFATFAAAVREDMKVRIK